AYMSPEQARGKPIDKRADIWAFGVMLWEMLTGNRLFDGETVSDTLAAVLRKEPEWESLPADTPPRIKRLVRRCLERNPKERLRDIGDARISIEDVLGGDLGEESGVQAAPAARPLPLVLLGAGALVVAAAAFWAGGLLGKPDEQELPLRKFVLPVPDLTIAMTRGTTLALAPDGTRIAYTSEGTLWVRDLDRVEPRPLAGTEGAIKPFWSPDGEWVGYAANQKLWKLRVTGGEPTALCDLSRNFNGAGGGVWKSDGEIIFGHGDGPILTVSSQGGDPDTLLAMTEADDDFHNVTGLPEDRGIVFVVHDKEGNWDRIDALRDGIRSEVIRHEGQKISRVCYSPSGHLVYHREPANEGIWAVPFSAEDLKVTGKPFLAVPNGDLPHVAADGTLVHAVGAGTLDSEFRFVDRAGTVGKTLIHVQQHGRPALSPDGRRVAVQIRGENDDICIMDVQRFSQTRLTFGPGSEGNPAWSPDGTRVYYEVPDGNGFRLLMKAADGTGEVAELGPGSGPSLSDDGKFLLYAFFDQEGSGWDIYSMPLGEDGLPVGDGTPLVNANGPEWNPRPSPDGRFVAYSAVQSGRSEIYLKRFPGGEGKWQVTNDGGVWPVWSAAGDELYFAKGRGLYAVSVQTAPSLHLGTPTLLFEREGDTGTMPFGWPDGFDVSADGRFLITEPSGLQDDETLKGIVLTQNWFAEFRSGE
ncbi:MAG: protein kinase, partial [Gemmatimonadetes bacterium]|nr:protein kinase [Gemmatimonadota bacterium]